MKSAFVCVLAAALAGPFCLSADVTYSETVHFNGGTLVDMAKSMASNPMTARMGQAFQDQSYTIYVKGNKMARVGTNSTTITDLDAGSITNIDHSRKTYTVMTFDQLKQMSERMQQMMGGQGSGLDFDIQVQKTGKTRSIDGQTATESIITAVVKGGGSAKFKADVWSVASLPGAEDLRAFHMKAAETSEAALGGSPMMGGAGHAMSAASRAALKLGGVPVETATQVSGVASSPMGAMGGGKEDPNAVVIDMTSTTSHWSAGPVDDAHFSVPAGYKKQERNFGPGGPGGRPPHQMPPQ